MFFICVQVSTRKNSQECRIEEVLNALSSEDTVIVAELSRFGRNMLQTLDLINEMSQMSVKLIFVRQPELSITLSHAKLPLAIYSYFAEAERHLISMRTRQGMASARAQGKHVGCPRGSRDRNRVLAPYRKQIRDYLRLQLPLRRIHSTINPQLEKQLSYCAYRYYVRQNEELLALWLAQRTGSHTSP